MRAAARAYGYAARILPRGLRRMRCYVYKSLRKADTYVYLERRDDFARLPEPMRQRVGELGFVLEFELDAQRTLAREDPVVVRRNLAERGFHIQYPPPEPIAHGGS
jgi:uncharacterized protein